MERVGSEAKALACANLEFECVRRKWGVEGQYKVQPARTYARSSRGSFCLSTMTFLPGSGSVVTGNAKQNKYQTGVCFEGRMERKVPRRDRGCVVALCSRERGVGKLAQLLLLEHNDRLAIRDVHVVEWPDVHLRRADDE